MPQTELELLPIRFDPLNFADHATELNGLVATRAMERLRSSTLSAEPMAVVKLQFSHGQYGYAQAIGAATTKVHVRCERCLDEFELELDAKIKVLIKPDSDRLPEDTDNPEMSLDFHEYDGNSLTLSDLIEEELLLTLPLVPRHQDISLCNQDMVAWLASNVASGEGQGEVTADKADNPFAILKR